MTTAISDPAAFLAAIAHMPQGLAVFDAGLSLVGANPCALSLLDLPPDLGRPGTTLLAALTALARRGDFGPGEPEELARRWHDWMAGGLGRRVFEVGAHTLEVHAHAVPGGGLVVTLVDIAEQVAAERELERIKASLERRVAERTATLTRVNAELEAARAKADAANRDKTRFLAAASHDLLQPLNAAKLYTATLIERARSTGLGELAHHIEASLGAVEDIMGALLDISRIDAGALKPAPVAFAIGDVLKKVEVEFAPLARERGVELILVPSAEGVLADRMLVNRIVQNLVSNAVKYTRPGGRVLVGVRRRLGKLRLDVIDTGIGFNRDQHALLFAEFSRLEGGARMAQGLGLGLSIVQRLVGAMGLTLELDSVEGSGSRFSLLLPRARAAAPAPAEPLPPEPAPGALDLRILCLDNERAILDSMAGLLAHWGCDVRTALSLKDIAASGLLASWYPDLVLVDYHLEQASGLDAIEWLRQNVGGHLPAALVTADRTPSVRALAEERGIPVLTKPVKPGALRAAITGLSGRRQTGSRPVENSASN